MKVLIIDGMNSCYAAYYAYAKLSHEGKPTSIIFGLPSMIAGLLTQHNPDHAFIVWDGKRSPHRKKLCPEYKEHRNGKMDETQRKMFLQQKDIAISILDNLGMHQVHSIDMEADDYIYQMCQEIKAPKDEKLVITIVSNDKDFHQMLRPGIKIWASKKEKFLTVKNFRTEYEFNYTQSLDYLCIIGDSSDNIKGVPGVGEKTAMILLNRFSSIKDFLASDETIPRIDKKVLAEVYSTNKKLIGLRSYYKRHVEGKVEIKFINNSPKLNRIKLERLCSPYGIRKFKGEDFQRPFKRLHENRKTDSNSLF